MEGEMEKTEKVRCEIPSVWTSSGKVFYDEEVELPSSEARQVRAVMKKWLKDRFKVKK